MSPERTRNSKNKPGMISTYPSRRSSSSRLAVEKIVLFGSPWGRCPVPCCFHSTPSTSLLLRKKVVLRFLFFSFSVCGRFFFFPTLFEHCTGLGCIMKVFFFFNKKGEMAGTGIKFLGIENCNDIFWIAAPISESLTSDKK